MDNKNRCIPGIIYIPNFNLLDNLIKNYNFTKNDMINMSVFYNQNKDICKTFPIIKQNNFYNNVDLYNENYNEFNGIFDGAAIGQYLGGCDPKNKNSDQKGFINETCEIKYNNYKFKWIIIDELYIPHIIIDNINIPIYNLHIHSKKLQHFLNVKPVENNYIII